MSQSAVANKLRLLKISPEVRRYILDQHLKERHARALLRIDEPAKMMSAAQAAVKQKMNAEQLEKYIDKLFDKQKQKEKLIFKGYCKDLRLYVNSQPYRERDEKQRYKYCNGKKRGRTNDKIYHCY